jgi:tyrosinase
MPYWDFAMTPAAGGNVFADEFRARAVGVYGPAGWQAILNPLYSYPFHPVEVSARGKSLFHLAWYAH